MIVNQNSDFIVMIHSDSAGITHMRRCIVCNVIAVEFITEKKHDPNRERDVYTISAI